MKNSIIPTHGGYKKLRSFQVAQLAYDVTVRFCDQFIEKRSRTIDQMVQAARSGVQNIAEGSQASGTSKKTELKLTSVARASLEELKLDYEDFIRQRGLTLWGRNDSRREELVRRRPKNLEEFTEWVNEVHRGAIAGPSGHERGLSGQITTSTQRSSPLVPSTLSSTKSIKSTPPAPYKEIAANGALTLIAVASALLERQLASLAKAFETDGGFTERLYDIRLQRKFKNDKLGK